MNFDTKEDLFNYINELTNKVEALKNSLAEKEKEKPKEKEKDGSEQEVNEIDSFLNKKGVNA